MREILLFSAAVCIAAVFAPQFLTELTLRDTVAGTEQTASRVERPKKKARKERGNQVAQANRAEIRAGSNGHFLLDADVNLNPVRFVVDTGASFVALRESDARAAGIHLGPTDFNAPVQTANGTTYAARVRLDSVAIDGIDVESVSAIVLPDNLLGISLLGNSFLNRLNRFEVSNNRLVMEN
jgi:aspartyl protease family protein